LEDNKTKLYLFQNAASVQCYHAIDGINDKQWLQLGGVAKFEIEKYL
jgi:hypothetical protein